MRAIVLLLFILLITIICYTQSKGIEGRNIFTAKLHRFFPSDNNNFEDQFEENIHSPYGINLSDSETAKLVNMKNVRYLMEVKIGDPKQSFKVQIDTGSSDLWVFSSDCEESKVPQCKERTVFTSKDSKSFTEVDKTFQKSYADDIVKGITGKDTVYLTDKLSIADQHFGAVTYVKRGKYKDYDGILGLGIKKTAEGKPPFLTAVDAKKVDPKFSLYIKRKFDSSDGGEITFGGHNPDHLEAATKVTAKLITERRYTIQMEELKFGDEELCKKSDKTCVATIDSGSTCIVGPKAVVDKINNDLLKVKVLKGMRVVNCKKIQTFPEFKIKLGDKTLILEAKHYIVQYTDRLCISKLSGIDVLGKSWVLGVPFLGKFYTEFNVKSGEQSVTFYEAK